jgi:hypothetical protein
MGSVADAETVSSAGALQRLRCEVERSEIAPRRGGDTLAPSRHLERAAIASASARCIRRDQARPPLV